MQNSITDRTNKENGITAVRYALYPTSILYKK
jgi:hypothetical protein